MSNSKLKQLEEHKIIINQYYDIMRELLKNMQDTQNLIATLPDGNQKLELLILARNAQTIFSKLLDNNSLRNDDYLKAISIKE